MWAYGVSPSNPNDLYAFDCGAPLASPPSCPNGAMWYTTSGGPPWHRDPVLTRLIQCDWNGNRYPLAGNYQLFAGNLFQSQPEVVAFDPQNSNHIVVGTLSVGTFVSLDGGRSWGRLPQEIPMVSSIVFSPQQDHFFLSSFGQGVYHIHLGQTGLTIDSTSGTAGTDVPVSATLVNPSGFVMGMGVTFDLVNGAGTTVASASRFTNAEGIASASLPHPAAGTYTLRAVFSGTSTLVGSQTESPFTVEAGSSGARPANRAIQEELR